MRYRVIFESVWREKEGATLCKDFNADNDDEARRKARRIVHSRKNEAELTKNRIVKLVRIVKPEKIQEIKP